jgi:hypothetical protein
MNYTEEEIALLEEDYYNSLYQEYPEPHPDYVAREYRNDDIAEMYKNRYTVRQIAANVGLSKSRVHQVIHMDKYSEDSGYEGWDELLYTAKFNKENKFCPRSKWLKSWL